MENRINMVSGNQWLSFKRIAFAISLMINLVLLYSYQKLNEHCNYLTLKLENPDVVETHDQELIKKLHSRVEILQEQVKNCDELKNQCDKHKLELENSKSLQLIDCYKTEVNLRTQMMEDKDQLGEVAKKLDDIDVMVKDVIKLSHVQSDQIARRNKQQFDSIEGHRIVHLDFKGAPPKIDYLIRIIQKIKDLGGTALLLEYEDMFPWSGYLAKAKKPIHYTETDINLIIKAAEEFDLAIIPSIPSISYIDFVLKLPNYAHLREHKNSTHVIDPTNQHSVRLIKEMINQILNIHHKSTWLHLGGTQVLKYLKVSDKPTDPSPKEKFLDFFIPLLRYVRTFRTKYNEIVKPIIWDDEIRMWSIDDLRKISPYVTPMVWSYDVDVEKAFPKDMWDRYNDAFDKIWLASSFKGTFEPSTNLVPIQRHIDNNLSWLRVVMKLKPMNVKVLGIALMGWSRFDHYAPLCELLPVSIPSLAICLKILKQGKFDHELHKSVSNYLKFEQPIRLLYEFPRKYKPEEAKFTGSRILRVAGWREKAIGYDPWTKNREKGWTRPYYLRRNMINFLYVNETLTDLRSALVILRTTKEKAESALQWYFHNETISEWLGDKIIEPIAYVERRIRFLENIFNTATFP